MEKNCLRCCFTGYRPEKFDFSLDENNTMYNKFVDRLFNAVTDLAESGVSEFYSGMAMGFDIIAAETVLDVARLRPDLSLRLVACVPYIEQASAFPKSWKDRYNYILSNCDKALLLSDKYYKGCFQRRNKFMVDSTDFVITYFDGAPGGTKNTVTYAKKQGKGIVNCYST